jgi:hypothetical protein
VELAGRGDYSLNDFQSEKGLSPLGFRVTAAAFCTPRRSLVTRPVSPCKHLIRRPPSLLRQLGGGRHRSFPDLMNVSRDRLVVLGAKLFEFIGVDDYVLAFGVLVARNDLIAGELGVDRAGFLMIDPALALSMELVQPNLGTAGSGNRMRFDGNRTS